MRVIPQRILIWNHAIFLVLTGQVPGSGGLLTSTQARNRPLRAAHDLPGLEARGRMAKENGPAVHQERLHVARVDEQAVDQSINTL